MRGRAYNLALALIVATANSFAVGCAGIVSGANTNTNSDHLAPALASQPSSQTVVVGQPATFAIVATGTAPLSYQWQKNGAIISGAASASYTTPATTTADNGSAFQVVVSNPMGSVTSAAAKLTVDSAVVAPTISTQPANESVVAGQTTTFSVVASGTAPLTYQWQKNGANITGATSANYTTPATTTTDNGSTFQVVVSNSAGSVTSNAATLTVNAATVAPTITTQPANQTVTAGQTATFSVVAAGTAPLGYQWQKNGANISGATSVSYTTAATTSADNGSVFQVVVSNSKGSITSNAATLSVTSAAVAPTVSAQPVNQTVTAGQTATFSVVASGTGPLSYQWHKNGANISGATSASYTTPATASADNGSTFQVVVSNSAGSVTSSAATLTVNAAVVAPTITTQPVNQTVTAGQTATFSVAAGGSAPLSYQWQKNGANISGATSVSYTTAATTSADNGSTFQVVVSNSKGSITSNAATLSVTSAAVAPTVSAQPVNQTVTAGQTATFSVVASGTGPLSYQWHKNGANISGATSASYTTPATASADNGSTFQVVVSNSAGSVTSSAATLTVNAAVVAPTVSAQPVNQTVTAGQTATFSVVASGTAPLSYQWQKNGANISGATSASYTTPATASADNGSTFQVVVSNSAGSVTSSAATLTVNAAVVAPTITTQPVNQTVTAGQTATFSVVASGTAPLSYQWHKNGANISGATSASYTTPATASADNGSTFQVVVSNSAGSVTSSAATLTVNAAVVAPTITTQPVNQTVTAGQTATFTVAATGSAPLSYQWQKNGTAISGATSASYSTPATTTSDSGATFRVVVSNSVGSVTSNSATLTIVTGSAIATVTVTAGSPGLAIPPTFMGISVDMFDAQNTQSGMGTPPNTNPVYRKLIQNLIFPGQGPFIFNIEEDSPSSSAPTATQVSTFAHMYADTGALFWLPANMCHNSTSEAAAEASAYLANMPPAAFLGMVMGNEPDGACSTYPSTFPAFETMYTTWQSAISSVSGGPGIKFVAPNFGGQMPLVWGPPGSDLNTFINDKVSTLAVASQHWYPGVGCGNTVPGDFLLTSAAATNLPSIIGPFTANAHSKGLPLVISEMNSVDCGGQSGVSNTFQSALWLADASFHLVSAGVDGIRVFNDQGNYDMFQFAQSPWRVSSIRPEYYGALMFQEATQNGAHLLPITLSTSANLTAWATVDVDGNVRVAVFNKDKTAQGNIIVAVTGLGNASLKTLTAPSYTSTTGVTYGGQTFDGSTDGTIQGTLSTTTVTPLAGVYTFTIAPTSAALLTVAP